MLALLAFGSRTLANALLQQCLVLFVRRLIDGEVEVGWLVDRVGLPLSKAVMAMPENPAGTHALSSLAARPAAQRGVLGGVLD